jgi:hypothetical protein
MIDMVTHFTRRDALRHMGSGFGMLSLAHLLGDNARAAGMLAPKSPHFPARAKRVVFLFLNGAPSHIDTFDPKPELTKHDGEMAPDAYKAAAGLGPLMGTPFTFRKYGQSGIEVSELFPKVAEHIDDCCVIRSMHTDNPGHEIGLMRMSTGHLVPGHPGMGSWITYGLGTENQNLPGFVVLCPGVPVMGAQLWTSAYLPGIYQGTHVRNMDELDPAKLIQYVQSVRRSPGDQRQQLNLLASLNRLQMQADGEPQLEASIQSMEMAFRMQTEAREVFDIRRESQATRDRYGNGHFAHGCLMARRLLQSGVRMVQIYFGNRNPWDSHSDIFDHRKLALLSDQPIAALLEDLKSTGLLDDTIVIVGGEFGRTPTKEISGTLEYGRNHNNQGFTVLVAGGGFKRGVAYGATDDLGFAAVEKPVHVNDLHATILHQLGMDHTKLTFRYSGRDFRLTDVGGNVIQDLIA